jgi:hypothetical protein
MDPECTDWRLSGNAKEWAKLNLEGRWEFLEGLDKTIRNPRSWSEHADYHDGREWRVGNLFCRGAASDRRNRQIHLIRYIASQIPGIPDRDVLIGAIAAMTLISGKAKEPSGRRKVKAEK